MSQKASGPEDAGISPRPLPLLAGVALRSQVIRGFSGTIDGLVLLVCTEATGNRSADRRRLPDRLVPGEADAEEDQDDPGQDAERDRLAKHQPTEDSKRRTELAPGYRSDLALCPGAASGDMICSSAPAIGGTHILTPYLHDRARLASQLIGDHAVLIGIGGGVLTGPCGPTGDSSAVQPA